MATYTAPSSTVNATPATPAAAYGFSAPTVVAGDTTTNVSLPGVYGKNNGSADPTRNALAVRVGYFPTATGSVATATYTADTAVAATQVTATTVVISVTGLTNSTQYSFFAQASY